MRPKTVQTTQLKGTPDMWVLSDINPRKVKTLPIPKTAYIVDALIEKKFHTQPYFYQDRIKPVFNRDGYYYDRSSGAHWAEFKGVGYLINHPDWFVYELLMADHKPLRDSEAEALAELKKHKLLTKELDLLYSVDSAWKEAHKTNREIGASVWVRGRKFKKEHGLRVD